MLDCFIAYIVQDVLSRGMIRSQTAFLLLIIVALAPEVACTDPTSPGDPLVEVTVSETGTGSGDNDTTVSSADDSGGEPSLVDGRCLFANNDAEANNVFGYRYQCRGRLEVNIQFDGDSAPIVVDYGSSIEDDSYAEPKVMACCPPAGVGLTCAEPHSQACVVDAIEQGCKSMAIRLEEFAQDLGPAPKEAALKAADYIATHQQDCFDTFAVDTGITTTPPGCDANSNSDPNFADLAIGASWSFDPPGLLNDVMITITNAEQQGVFPWTSDAEYPGEECLSSDFNDHVAFSELPPELDPDDLISLLHGQVEIRGPMVLETAALASVRTGCSEACSRLAVVETASTAKLSYMLGRGDTPVTIGGLAVDAFRAELVGEVDAVSLDSSAYEIPRADAIFAISGQALGNSALVSVTNHTPIRFRPGYLPGSWDVDPIQLRYTDEEGSVYDFFLGATQWQ
ncbi:MAG: hypothetical protein AAGF11_51170 [Myxococcota bacterium]